uniref:C2H2-type domain-containing protein n=1 Tax=Rhabditophanes sp. KR3021 TaxID=114890 RepID=A0AC35U2P6_9BILA
MELSVTVTIMNTSPNTSDSSITKGGAWKCKSCGNTFNLCDNSTLLLKIHSFECKRNQDCGYFAWHPGEKSNRGNDDTARHSGMIVKYKHDEDFRFLVDAKLTEWMNLLYLRDNAKPIIGEDDYFVKKTPYIILKGS